MAPVEKRVDPDDGHAYTWEELNAFYKGKYKKNEIASYWESCKVVKAPKAKTAESTGKAAAKSKSKGKAAAPEPKAKAKAKVKALANPLSNKKVKLYYWPARGRGEQVRLALAATHVEFEDVTFDMTSDTAKQEFFARCRELGGNATNNTPMLEVNGKFYTQSLALVKFVCACAGMMLDNAKTQYKIDEIIGHVEDLRTASYKPIVMMGGGEKEKAAFLELLPKHLGNLERLLGSRKFFASPKLTAADICVYDLLDTMVVTQVPNALEAWPKLAAFRERMSKLKGIDKYHASEQHKKLWAFPAL